MPIESGAPPLPLDGPQRGEVRRCLPLAHVVVGLSPHVFLTTWVCLGGVKRIQALIVM